MDYEQNPNEYKVDVVIDGEIVTLKSKEHPDHMQRLARYIDGKLTEIKSKNLTAAVDEHLRTLLISLNVADDYFKTLDKYNTLDIVHNKFVQELTKMQEENSLLSGKLQDLQAELTRTRTELDEFVQSFGEEKNKKENKKEEEKPDNIFSLPLKDRKAAN